MAVRSDASADGLSATTNLPTITGFTIMGWFLRSGTGQSAPGYEAVIGFGGASTGNKYACYFRTAGAATFAVTEWTTDFTGSAISDNTWYHVAMTVAGTGANQLKGYLNGVLDATGNGSAGITAAQLQILGDAAGEWFNGKCAAVKIYNAVLTVDEIALEMRQYLPFRTANLNRFIPGIDSTTLDYSGSANNLTAGGTLAFEDGPPIPWRRGRARIFIPAAATGAQTVNLGFIASGEQIFGLTVIQNVLTGFIASGEQIFTPAVSLKVLTGFIASGEVVSAITVSQNVGLPFIASGEQIFTPAVTQNVLLGFVGTGEQVFAPTITGNIGLGFVASGEVVSEIVVSQNVGLPFIASGEQIFAPTVTENVTLGFVASGEQTFAINVSNAGSPSSQTVNLGFVGSEEQVFGLTVSGVNPTAGRHGTLTFRFSSPDGALDFAWQTGEEVLDFGWTHGPVLDARQA